MPAARCRALCRARRRRPPGVWLNSAQDVEDAGAEDDEIDDDEGDQRGADRRGVDVGEAVGGAQQAIDGEGLAADSRWCTSRRARRRSRTAPSASRRDAAICWCRASFDSAPRATRAPMTSISKPRPTMMRKVKNGISALRPLVGREVLEALDRGVEVVGEDQRAELGDLDGVMRSLRPRRRGCRTGSAARRAWVS